jgi:glycosyltransferase involved in cell wall biosynthesis
MRILHVIASMNPDDGGPPEAVYQMALEAERQGDRAEIVTADDPKASFLSRYETPVHAMGPGRFGYGYSPHLRPWLRENLGRFDGVVVHGMWLYHGQALWSEARKRTPYAIFPHGTLDPYFKQRYPAKHVKKWLHWKLVQYKILRDAKYVLFTAEAESELALQPFRPNKWNALVVPFGTSEPPQDAEGQKEIFFAQCAGLQGRRFALFLGRIHDKKGVDLLVQGFAKVAQEAPDLHLVIAGPDSEGLQTRLILMARELGVAGRIHWVGMLAGAAKWGAIRASEVFILPSHQENFGIAAVEAMACERPALITDKVNIWREIVSDGAGLVAADTLDGTVKLLRGWLHMSAEEKARMRIAARESFLRRFSMNACSRALSGLFAKE